MLLCLGAVLVGLCVSQSSQDLHVHYVECGKTGDSIFDEIVVCSSTCMLPVTGSNPFKDTSDVCTAAAFMGFPLNVPFAFGLSNGPYYGGTAHGITTASAPQDSNYGFWLSRACAVVNGTGPQYNDPSYVPAGRSFEVRCPSGQYITGEPFVRGVATTICLDGFPLVAPRPFSCSPCPTGTYGELACINECDAIPVATPACVACPTGAYCAGGGSITNDNGWWQSYDIGRCCVSPTFVPCDPSAACLRGGQCREGSWGDACMSCSRGYIWFAGQGCLTCSTASAAIPILVVLAWVIIGLVFIVLVQTPSSYYAACAVLIGFLQTLGLIGGLDGDWALSVSGYIFALRVLAGDLPVLTAFACYPPGVYNALWYARILIVYIILFVYLIVFAINRMCSCRRCGRTKGPEASAPTFWRRLINAWLATSNALFVVTVKAALVQYECLPQDATPGQTLCDFDDDQPRTFRGVSIFVTVLSIIIPTIVQIILLYCRHDLWRPNLSAIFGATYEQYRLRYFWFESLVMLRRCGLLAALAIGAHYENPAAAGSIMLVVVIVFGVAHAVMRPYKSPAVNRLELVSFGCCFIAAACGLAVVVGAITTNQSAAEGFIIFILAKFLLAACVLFVYLIAVHLYTWRSGLRVWAGRDAISVHRKFLSGDMHVIKYHHSATRDGSVIQLVLQGNASFTAVLEDTLATRNEALDRLDCCRRCRRSGSHGGLRRQPRPVDELARCVRVDATRVGDRVVHVITALLPAMGSFALRISKSAFVEIPLPASASNVLGTVQLDENPYNAEAAIVPHNAVPQEPPAKHQHRLVRAAMRAWRFWGGGDPDYDAPPNMATFRAAAIADPPPNQALVTIEPAAELAPGSIAVVSPPLATLSRGTSYFFEVYAPLAHVVVLSPNYPVDAGLRGDALETTPDGSFRIVRALGVKTALWARMNEATENGPRGSQVRQPTDTYESASEHSVDDEASPFEFVKVAEYNVSAPNQSAAASPPVLEEDVEEDALDMSWAIDSMA